ncbi:hypothetical protein [Mycobacterium sp. NPDC050441]|uniref:hypothetical protein n=1 Tax=Mycobacterium sp. NPDC050441 TaxID=3155403 RepID=UPI0033E631B7
MRSEIMYIPNELLSRLVGARLYSVEMVLNEYLHLMFDGAAGGGEPAVLACYVWPVVESSGRVWHESDLGYADSLRKLTPGAVTSTVEQTGIGIRIELDTGTLVIHPKLDEVYVEIAMLTGFTDGAWMVWRPGEDSFEDLA